MTSDEALAEAIQAIHLTLEQAEYQLARLGPRLQYLVGPEGRVEIVRRSETGSTLRPKVVIAELKGCDSMLWRPDHPGWMRMLDPERAESEGLAGDGGAPPSPDAGAGDGSADEGGGAGSPAGAVEES